MGTVRRTRKGGPRRTRHPMPDLTLREARYEEGAAVRRGPQAELCRSTMCCVCWTIGLKRWARDAEGSGCPPVDLERLEWPLLPRVMPGMSIAHHEPCQGDDDDTVPLCVRHHTGPSFKARHPGNAEEFWSHYGIDWEAVRDEMRRRVRER